METNQPGIFVSGARALLTSRVCFQHMSRLPVRELLSYRRGNLSKEIVYPPEGSLAGGAELASLSAIAGPISAG